MTITDQPTTDRWTARVDAAQHRWHRAQEEANAALADLTAALVDRPAPADPHVHRFPGDVRVGDHVEWDGGWWYVTDASHLPGGARLTLTRVGYQPLQLDLGGNVLLTTVRPAA